MITTTITAIGGFFCAVTIARAATVEVDTKAAGHESTGELKK